MRTAACSDKIEGGQVSNVMLLRHPRSCCCQPQSSFILFFPRGLISSTSSIPVHISISIPIPIRTYSSPRPSKSQSKAALQRSQPSFVALNPTITTHPPPLNLPEKLPTLPKYRYYFRVGKAYAVFYKTGLKAIWTNYKLARDLPHRIFFSDQIRIHRAVRHGLLSRADLQLIRRTRRDINKVPLFALIWLVCGEFTPLVIIFFTGAVPRTSEIPFPSYVILNHSMLTPKPSSMDSQASAKSARRSRNAESK